MPQLTYAYEMPPGVTEAEAHEHIREVIGEMSRKLVRDMKKKKEGVAFSSHAGYSRADNIITGRLPYKVSRG